MSENDEHDGSPEQDSWEVPSEDDPATGPGPRRKRRWLPFVLIGVVVLAIAAGAIFWQLRPKANAEASQQFVEVSRQTLKQSVSATGTIEPAKQTDLSFSSDGSVTAVNVEVGDAVTRGEVLATIDDSSLQADVDSAKASLAASRETRDTLEDDSGSTDAELAAAKADVRVKKTQLAQARTALKGAELKAPFSGVVADVGISVGDSSEGDSSAGSEGSGSNGSGGSGSGAADDSSSSSDASDSGSITLISTDSWTVDTSVSGTDLSSVKKGLQAQITPTGASDPIFGIVQTVGVIATSSDGGASTFPVTIKVTGAPKGLHAGESGSVSIIVKQIADAVVVPTLAVKTASGQTVVDKKTGNHTVQTKITIGDTYGTFTQVTRGLKVGDQVAITIPGRIGAGAGNGNGNGQGSGDRGGFSGGRSGGVPGGSGGFPGSGSGGFAGGNGGGFPGGQGQGGK